MAFIQAVTGHPTPGATNQITITGVAAHSLLILTAQLQSDTRNITGITDDRTNGWAEAAPQTGNGGGEGIATWYAKDCAAGTTIVTVTWDITPTNIYWAIAEYSGIATATPLDQAIEGYTPSAAQTLTIGPVTTTQNSETLIGVGTCEIAGRPFASLAGAGWTVRVDNFAANSYLSLWDKDQTTLGSQSLPLSTAPDNQWIGGHLMTFKNGSTVTPITANLPADDLAGGFV